MGTSLNDLLGAIYAEDVPDQIGVGSICLAPVLYSHPTINVIRPISDDPAHPDNKKYQITSISKGKIAEEGAAPTGHRFPDKTLNIGLGEDLFVIPGKRRPVIVLFNPTSALSQVGKDGHKSEKDLSLCYGCVPSYTLIDQYGNPRHKTEFIEQVRALAYNLCCYLPEHSAFRDRDSFLRMDKMCWIPERHLRPLGVKLTRNGRDYVRAWYDWFCGVRELDESLALIRTLLLEELAQQAAKKKR